MTELKRERYRLDLGDARLWDGDAPVHLTGKSFQLLRLFVQNPNRLLTKDEIAESLWHDIHVSDGLVKEYVHDLRAALHDNPRSPHYIETVRGRGYRYLGGIACASESAMPRNGPPRIAVLPWEHFDDSETLALFGRGFSAELTSVLAKNRDLAVIARSSTAGLADEAAKIGRARDDLHADYVIEGEVFPDGNGVRLALNAVNAETESIVWSDSFSVQEDRLSCFGQELVPRVALAIGARSGPLVRDMIAAAKRRMPSGLTAFERYLLAADAYAPHTPEGISQARELVTSALRMDPDHAQSWLLLAYILEEIRDHAPISEEEAMKVQRNDAIGRAAELDPLDGRVLIEHADLLYDMGDLAASAEGYARAYEMNRGAADVLTVVAKYLAGVNDAGAEARRALSVARDLNPVGDLILALNELRTYYLLGDYGKALTAAAACPDTSTKALFVALVHHELGEEASAREIVRREQETHADFAPMRFLESHHYIRSPAIKARFRKGLGALTDHLS